MSITIRTIDGLDMEIPSDGVAMVVFYAEWCKSCSGIQDIFDFIEGNSIVKLLIVNVDESKELVQDNDVKEIPCYVFYKNGVEINRLNGNVPIGHIVQQLRGI